MTNRFDDFLSPHFNTPTISFSICVGCNNEITEFRDMASKDMYFASGLCQECQDARTFKEAMFGDDDDNY